MFREISEFNENFSNKKPSVLLTRVFVRYITIFIGYRISAIIFSKIILSYKYFISINYDNFCIYLLKINYYRNRCLYLLSTENYKEHEHTKLSWAQFVITHSVDSSSKDNAIEYLNISKRLGPYAESACKIVSGTSDKLFYIHGPNADIDTFLNSYDYTIVLTKPVDFDISRFKKSILFLNSTTYKKISNNVELLNNVTKKYSKIYVSCLNANLSVGFERLGYMNAGNKSGLMGLGRILPTLVERSGNIRCIINGFDLYLSSNAYCKNYDAGHRQSDGSILEKGVCKSLADHDALYNFKYLKYVCEYIDIFNSDEFQNIIDMSSNEYMKKLITIRNFNSMKVS